MTTHDVDYDRALLDPKACFDEPEAVLRHTGLGREQKIAVLRSWERDARELSVAEEEGMGDGEADMLRRVVQALRELGADDTEHGVPFGKQGG